MMGMLKSVIDNSALRKVAWFPKLYNTAARLSGHFAQRWPGAGIWLVRYPFSFGMVWTLDPNRLYSPKGFGLGILMAELWPF